jgi:hypothetical protein
MLQDWYTMTLHREMFSLLLADVCSVISKVCKVPFRAQVNFINGVDACGTAVHVSARAYGTEFVVQPYGQLTFRQIELNGVSNPSHWESPEAFKIQDIRDLIVSFFDSGMLELKPVKQIDPMVAGLANAVMRMQRKY